MITTTEAARIAEVTPSTIKRWADQGLIPVLRTVGGHRRFDRSDLERFVRTQGQVDSAKDPIVERWLKTLLYGASHEVDGALLEARARLGSWYRVADELGVVFTEMGRQWAAGEISIAQEHMASHAIMRAIARICDALPSRTDGPVALLACPEGEEHTLALALVELCFSELGWRVTWLGRRTPLSELVREVARGEVAILALSASKYFSDESILREVVETLGAVCLERSTHLLIGGTGPWPEEIGEAVRMTDFDSLHRWLAAA